MNWRITLPSLALAGVMLSSLPATLPQAHAGDQEWAVAGKVLTGIIAVDVLRNVWNRPSRNDRYDHGYQSHYYRPQPRYYAPPREVVYYAPPPPQRTVVVYAEPPPLDYITPRSQSEYQQPGTVQVHNHYHGNATEPAAQPAAAPQPAQPAPQQQQPAPVVRTEQTVHDSGEADAVVLVIEEGRRIWQPRTRGAKAYMQVWNELDKKWVAIKEYPSIY